MPCFLKQLSHCGFVFYCFALINVIWKLHIWERLLIFSTGSPNRRQAVIASHKLWGHLNTVQRKNVNLLTLQRREGVRLFIVCSWSNSQVCEEYRRDANEGMRSNIAKRQTSFWNSKGIFVSVWLNQAKSPFAPASSLWQWCLRKETRHGVSSVWYFPWHVLPASASCSGNYFSIFGSKKHDGLLFHEFSLWIQLLSLKCIYYSFFFFSFYM